MTTFWHEEAQAVSTIALKGATGNTFLTLNPLMSMGLFKIHANVSLPIQRFGLS